MTRRIVAVHAHPDDESITMGGTLAACAASGVGVTLVTATLGEQGEVMPADVLGPDGLPGLGGLASDSVDQLGGYRLAELAVACAALGVDDHRMLGGIGTFRDSGMVGAPSAAHPRAFVRASAGGPDHERAVALLAAVLDELRPQVVLTYDTDGGYGHPDHIAAHQVAVAAALRCGVPRVLAVVRPRALFRNGLRLVGVPAGYARAGEDDVGTLVEADTIDIAVPVGFFAAARRAALAAHRTQLALLPGGFALTNVLAQPLLPYECYRILHGPPAPGGSGARVAVGAGVLAGKPDDLFVGLAS